MSINTPTVLGPEELDHLEQDQYNRHSEGWLLGREKVQDSLKKEVQALQLPDSENRDMASDTLTPHNIRQAAFQRIEKATEHAFQFEQAIATELRHSASLRILQKVFHEQISDYLKALAKYTNEKSRKGKASPKTQINVKNTSALVMRQLEAHPLLAHPRSLTGYRKMDNIKNLFVGLGLMGNDMVRDAERAAELERMWGQAEPRAMHYWIGSTHFNAVFDDERGDQPLGTSGGSFGLKQHLMLMSSHEDIQMWLIENDVRVKIYTALSNGGYDEEQHE